MINFSLMKNTTNIQSETLFETTILYDKVKTVYFIESNSNNNKYAAKDRTRFNVMQLIRTYIKYIIFYNQKYIYVISA